MRRTTPLLALLSLGCRQLEPAPTELDALAHFFFLEFDSEETGRLVEGLDNLDAWYEDHGDPEGLGGSLTDVDQAARDAVGLDDSASFEYINGVFELVPHQGCSVEDMGTINLYEDQESLFPGQYEDYGRSYREGRGCFSDGDCDDAEWMVSIQDSMVGKTMTYDMVVQMRRVRREDGEAAGILTRVYMPEPGLLGGEPDGNTFFDQSYQIETATPHSARSNLHFYGVWNSGGLRGFDPDAEIWTNQYLKGVEDWNDRLDELCAEDRGLWGG
jgi:hypothetical protein